MSASITPETIPIRAAGEPPGVLAPDPARVFLVRAERFEQLATGHPLGAWLGFLAALTRVQHRAIASYPTLTLPDADALALACAHRMPVVPAQSWQRAPVWRDVLAALCADLLPLAPTAAVPKLQLLQALPAADLEALAEQVLHTDYTGPDNALLPYVAAALQVHWTAAASRLAASLQVLDAPGVCPCCGFLPVGSVVKSAGDVANLRYLHCALCNTEWNLVRVKCAACDATESIGYRLLEDADAQRREAVRAETCDSCHSYLKIIYQEKGGVDPVADDLATLALDILLDEAGYGRAGPNLLLVPEVA